MTYELKLKNARGAGECIVTKYDAGIPVSVETLAPPTVEESQVKFAKRGPKPGMKYGKVKAGYDPKEFE